ncbi:TPA: hypothetical protein UMT89_000357 [Stenotrophomonas maltophilia]|nr:hypothetical protein [Stenotrophomonas maltophilia]
MSLVVAVWSADSGRMANETVSARLGQLRNHLTQIVNETVPTFMVFIAAEFLFMHGRSTESSVRWYSPTEINDVLSGLEEISRAFPRTLLVGGTVCWAQAIDPLFGRTEWHVRNQTPVYYSGMRLVRYGKRPAGAEILAEDALRRHCQRRSSLDRTLYVPGSVDEKDGRKYESEIAIGSMGYLAGLAKCTVCMGSRGADVPAASGVRKAVKNYAERCRFVLGREEPSFAIPGGSFTAGVEVCQEHNKEMLIVNSALRRTNFHLLVSSTVTSKAASENLRAPGYFTHAKAGCSPGLVHLDDDGIRHPNEACYWRESEPRLHYTNLKMPKGLCEA